MTSVERTDLPLSDLRVVELGNIVAGPFAGSMLADLGADVVKVERPGTGDIIRTQGETGEAMFAALNRNKRSITLDLKSEAGLAAFFELVDDADVFVENLGRGAPERLGIGAPGDDVASAAEAVLDGHDLPTEARRVLDDAIETARGGDSAAATQRLRDAFGSKCAEQRPEETVHDAEWRSECFRHDRGYESVQATMDERQRARGADRVELSKDP